MLRKIGANSASKTCRRIAKQSEVGSAYCLHIDFRHRSGFGSSPRLIEARQRFSCLRSTEQMPKTSAKRSRATAARDRTDERLQKTLSFCALSSDSSWWFDEERFGQAHFSQGVYAGSCGICCLSSVLALHGLVPAHSLRDMAYRTRGLPARIWRTLGSSFFTGLGAKELMAACSELDLPLQLRSSFEAGQSKCASVFTLEQLLERRLTMVQLVSTSGAFMNHWSLGVGIAAIGAMSEIRPAQILLMDSSAEATTFGHYNAWLAMMPRSRRGMRAQQPRWIYRVPSSHRAEVRIAAAVSFEYVAS